MLFIRLKKLLISILLLLIVVISIAIVFIKFNLQTATIFVEQDIVEVVKNSFEKRNKAILEKDIKTLKSLYDLDRKYGVWAYEHEFKKMKYLHLWSKKQGIRFIDIESKPMVRWAKKNGDKYTINILTCTKYKYIYEDDINTANFFRIGTYHSLDLEKGDSWKIIREWYTDPFADSLDLDINKDKEITTYINNQSKIDLTNLSDRRINAVKYADKYCGAAGSSRNNYSYNRKYKNYNNLGGDCANFASQIFHEGGGFKKTGSWNYKKDGSRAWVNAHSLKNYMIYSGRASLVAYGTYKKVYKASYNLLPGDLVAYGKKGKVTHVSVVTGVDSKGYRLVNCHNTDRYKVPWDLGWSDRGVRFWLIHVHY